jgi:hypothetical protein
MFSRVIYRIPRTLAPLLLPRPLLFDSGYGMHFVGAIVSLGAVDGCGKIVGEEGLIEGKIVGIVLAIGQTSCNGPW